jgi:Domain of unknown function (DUF5615)
MRILLDECVPWPLAGLLLGHESSSVQLQGWTGTENAELLRRAAAEFELLITIERGVDEQNVINPPLAILELSTNDLRRIRFSAPGIMLQISSMQPGDYRKLVIN